MTETYSVNLESVQKETDYIKETDFSRLDPQCAMQGLILAMRQGKT